MMMSNQESGRMSSDEFGSSRLLHDIEEIRKALYLPDVPSKTSMPPRDRPPQNPKYAKDDLLQNGKKSSIWKWKPLKALTHIRNHRLTCCFFLHVHSIEGLPPNFNDLSLCVYWKRKHEVLKSHSIRVKDGIAEFEETLIRRCSVYVSKSDPHDDVAKYEPKLCVLYASIVGAPSLDIGKHWIDLTRLLPLTLMELEEEKNRYGKWVTSFKLSGKAKGATINVSFGFSLSGEHFSDLAKNPNIPKGNGASHNGVLRRVGSIPSNSSRRTHVSSLSLDMKVHDGIVPYEGPSIPFLYQLLDESKSSNSKEFNSISTDSLESSLETEVYDSDFTILDKGTEFSTKDEPKMEENGVESVEDSCIETINVDELFEGDEDNDEVCDISSKDPDNVCTKEFTIEELELFFNNLSTFESTEMDDFSFHENPPFEHDGGKMVRSHSLDDLANVVDDFMNLVGSDSEPESPRERLLRQFEKEALVSGNFAFDLTPKEEERDSSNIFDLSSLFQEAEMENEEGVGPSLLSRRKAKILENLETEALMQEWGLNERAFQNSPRSNSGAFGSPVYLSPERPSELPSLGEGLGSFLKTGSGGFLRSVDPSVFKQAKNGARLIVQVSSSVVLPPAMGSNGMDILLNWAAVGAEKMHLQATHLMPLEEITGKTLQQASWEAESEMEVLERFGREQALLHESEVNEMPTSICCEIDPEHVSEGNIAPLAIEKIQHLLIEGLKIQSGLSTEEPPSTIPVQHIARNSASTSKDVKQGSYSNFIGNLNDIEELIDMSISLEEWTRLDCASFDAEYEANDHVSKVFATHSAKTDKKCGHLSDNFTLALQMLLRDPFRDYEPVGIPMLALVQVERTYVDPMFKITEVHVAGFRADPGKKQQSGSRWLHSSGMTGSKTKSYPLTKSNALVRSSLRLMNKVKHEEILWSISSYIHGEVAKWKELSGLSLYARNPDIVLNENTEF